VAGSYIPKIVAGPPKEKSRFKLWKEGDITIFYPPRLKLKPFTDRIRICLKQFLFLKWLELEGAAAIVCAPAEE